MDVRPVDPRDSGWEIGSPSYRVYFWEQRPARGDVSQHLAGYGSTEFEVSGATEVGEVLAWAEATAPSGASYTVYALVELGSERGLVRLAGVDPTAAQ